MAGAQSMLRSQPRARHAVSSGRSASSDATWLAPTAVGAVTALVAVILLVRLPDPIGVRPDSWSEAEVIVSGRGYARSGFAAYAGLPQHQIGPPVDPYYLYANYPVASNLLYGALHVLGADRDGLYRLPAIAASLAALVLWYLLIARVVDRGTAVAALIALASTAGFSSYADNIHQQAYPLAPAFGALLCFVNAVRPAARARRWWYAGCAGCLLLVGLFTVELHAWLIVALIGYAALFGVRLRWAHLALLAPLLVGAALQWAQAHLGSPVAPEARTGFADNLYRRSLGFADAVDTPLDASGHRLALATYPAYMFARFGEFYRVPAWLVPLLLLVGFVGSSSGRGAPRAWPAAVKLLVILLGAGLAWMAIMMQQTAVHPATMRQLLPFWALLVGIVWAQAMRTVLDRHAALAWRVLLPAAALGLLAVQVGSTTAMLRMHFDRRYQDPVLMDGAWSESADFLPLATVPRDAVILTNHNRLPLIRYWADRPVYAAGNWVPPGNRSGRTWLDLGITYVRGLYRSRLPHLVYLYRVMSPTAPNIAAAFARDPLLRALISGSFDTPPTQEAQERAVAAWLGRAPAACPILVRGANWCVFDLAPIVPELTRRFDGPTPTLAELPAPR
jgi:hypothetical protein